MTRIFAGIVAAAILCAIPGPARAQQSRQFDLPAGSLQQAIIELARQADISIAIVDPALARIRVNRLSGRFTTDQALRRILSGTGARVVALGGGNYRIVRAPDKRAVRLRPAPAPVQPKPEVAEGEIVVIGSKRSTRVGDYAGTAIVLEGDRLDAAAGTRAVSERVPSLGSTHLGPGRDKLFIRAVADSSFSGQTQATVGQYLGEARLNYNALDPDLRLYDIASVELLAGPQGTLYGAGSMGGVLRFVPNAPDLARRSAAMVASTAMTEHGDVSHELAGVVNLPLVEQRAAIRMIGYSLSDGGYIDDIGRKKEDINRTHIRGGRVAGLMELSRHWSIEAGGLHQSIDGEDGQYADRAEADLVHRGHFAQPFSNDYSLAYLTLRGEAGKVRLLSTLSVADQSLAEQFEFSGESQQLQLFKQQSNLSLLSGESRASRTRSDGTGWIVGISFVDNKTDLRRSARKAGLWKPLSSIRNHVEEQTIYGELTSKLLDHILVTGGVRITHVGFGGSAEIVEELPVPAHSSARHGQWRLLPSLAASAKVGSAGLVYLRYQQGFRPGGLILQSTETQELKGDRIAAWEAGFRFGQDQGSALGGTFALIHSRWKNVQSDLVDTVGLPTTANVGDAAINTLEASLDWKPVRPLRLRAAGTFNTSRLTSSALGIITIDDEPLPNVPRAVVRAEVEYSVPSARFERLRFSGSARYVGKSRLGVGPVLGRSQGGYLDLGADVRIGGARKYLFLSATNLLDIAGNRFALGSPLTIVSEDQVTPLRPRTIRLGLQATY